MQRRHAVLCVCVCERSAGSGLHQAFDVRTACCLSMLQSKRKKVTQAMAADPTWGALQLMHVDGLQGS